SSCMRYTIHADGGSRGNPGPAGAGAVVRDERGAVIGEVAEFLGHTTNNVAEYTAIARGLALLFSTLGGNAKAADVVVRMDSKLVVEQMNGNYKIKHPNLKPLAARVSALLPEFNSVTFTHIPREENSDADALANKAMDEGS